MPRIVDRLEEILAGVILAAMTLLAMANVATRYFVHYALAF